MKQAVRSVTVAVLQTIEQNRQKVQSHIHFRNERILLETEINVESTLNLYRQKRGRTATLWLAPLRNSIIF